MGFTATGAKLQVTSVVPAQAKDTVPPNPLVTLTVPVTDEVAPRARQSVLAERVAIVGYIERKRRGVPKSPVRGGYAQSLHCGRCAGWHCDRNANRGIASTHNERTARATAPLASKLQVIFTVPLKLSSGWRLKLTFIMLPGGAQSFDAFGGCKLKSPM